MKSFFLILVLIQLTLQVDHCLIQKSVCKKCKTNYYLSDGICKKSENCEKMSYDGNYCDN